AAQAPGSTSPVAQSAEPTEPTPAPPGSRPAGATRDGRWWLQLDDPELTRLVERALGSNLDVRAGIARVEQARYVAMQAAAARYPDIGLRGTFATGTSLTTAAFGKSPRSTMVSGSIPVSYEVDLFAKNAQAHRAAKLRRTASERDLDALAMSLSASVAEAWYDLIDARAQGKLLGEQLETNRRYLDIVDSRYKQGLTSILDVRQQRQLVAQSEAQIALIAGQEQVAAQRLAVLLGSTPEGISGAPARSDDGAPAPADAGAPAAGPVATAEAYFAPARDTLPALPPTPIVDAPASLVQNRPDLRAIARRVQAADRQVASSIATFLPTVTATFTPTYQWLHQPLSPGLMQIGKLPTKAHAFTWNAGVTLSGPIFDGLLRHATTRLDIEQMHELIAEYSQAILGALVEVDSALVLERQQRIQITHLREQSRLASETLDTARDMYKAGLSDFLPVLTALQSEQAAQLQLLAAHRQLLSNRIQLYRALGGALPADMLGPKD
ncbi:MAG: TolC family protein, partial [Myxococcales bacterium]|nr:TolC family protein [Myxococcales bacterium]